MMGYRYWSAPSCPVVLAGSGTTQEHITNYLIHRKFTDLQAYSTVENDARHLVAWLNYLEKRNTQLYEATTLLVEKFRDSLVKNVSVGFVNKHLTSICAFYWYAQTEGFVENIIGWNDKATGIRYRIRVSKQKPGARSSVPYRLPFLIKETQQPQQRVPTPEELLSIEDAIHAREYKQNPKLSDALRIRNMLIFRYLSVVGLRRNELVNLYVEDIPSELSNDDYLVKVLISRGTKGNKPRRVEIPKELVEETLKYIKYERAEILASKKKVFGDASKNPHLFVNTGNNAKSSQMEAQTIYKFLEEINPDVTPHALRRFAFTRYAAVLFRLERVLSNGSGDKQIAIRENLLHRVAVQAGHNSVDTTIRFYVDTGMSLALSLNEVDALDEREITLEMALLRQRKHGSSIAKNFG